MILNASSGESTSQSETKSDHGTDNSSTAYLIIEWLFNYTLKALEKLSPLFILYGTAAFIGFTKKLLS